ncbi:MAG TPA: serine/threonine-protein kinase [Bryobacteraceae bacterium]|nr:serine/threonine-protein kinase [Bryobacteraceae bacterium]
MAQCLSCSAENPEQNRYCGVCGAALGSASEVPTAGMAQAKTPTPSNSPEEGRFPPGTMLAERYRIVGLLGQGGMGEVYRANDLKLGQPVALKFLPQATAKNQQLLARFHAEVRIARQVSHPNVCRVYDIGEADGSTFLSMEYVDGENLHSLLRRIGRLPPDKAVEIARKLCAGLAAAHDKGVLHRDLKPANVMIDGRGQVLIADFGLAALAGQLDGTNVRDGTPAYMAPEQLAGKEASVRSDVYALGLVLHEMFTGKRLFECSSQRTTPTSVTSLAKDIDPLVERVILRCLDVDPRNRPPSALAVAAALPGGDPLAAALAAGDTPTPGMVAASGDTEGISVRAAGVWLALILLGVMATVVLGARTNVFRQTPFEKPPAILEERARNLIRSFGYAEPPADSAYGFRIDTDYTIYAERLGNTAAYRGRLARGEPPPIQFWYRQSPQSLVPLNYVDGLVSRSDPPPIASGMVELNLDPQGRLIQFDAVPPQVEKKPESSRPVDWPGMFTAAGLDMARFTPAEPQWVPLAAFDARAAWAGAYSQSSDLALRVEAASWHGKPVAFRVIGPWSRPERLESAQIPGGAGFGAALILALCVLAFLLAWRNFRGGRGDMRGASRLATFVFGVEMLGWLCTVHHVSTIREMDLFQGGVMWAAFVAGAVWTFYMALEPYVRRRWPESMVTWSRVLGGEFRDPLVGGHMLAGVALGIGGSLFFYLQRLFLEYDSLRIPALALPSVLDARHTIGAVMFDLIRGGIWGGLGLVFLFFVLRVLLRRQWIAVAVFVLLFGVVTGLAFSSHPMIGTCFGVLAVSFFLTALLRFGVLAAIICIFVPPDLPLTTDLSAWYSGPTVFVVAIVLALAGYAFHTAVAGRPLFRAGFLESD